MKVATLPSASCQLLALVACRAGQDAGQPSPPPAASVRASAQSAVPAEHARGTHIIVCPPNVETSVLEVDLERRVVVLGAGRYARVEPGHVFYLYRGTTLKALIRVTLVEENRCEGTIEDLRNALEPGDLATTYL